MDRVTRCGRCGAPEPGCTVRWRVRRDGVPRGSHGRDDAAGERRPYCVPEAAGVAVPDARRNPMALHARSSGGREAGPPPASAQPAADRTPTRVLPRGTVVLLTLGSAAVVAIGMGAIRGVLTPVLLALILIICVQPVRTALRRRRVPEALATVSVVGVGSARLAGFVLLVVISVSQFVAMLPANQDQLDATRSSLRDWLLSIGFDPSQADGAANALDPHRVTAFVSDLLGGAFNLTGALVIVLTMLILMAADAV